jgi:hypothetical protein
MEGARVAYRDFTLREVLERFDLTLIDVPDRFADAPEVEPSPLLHTLPPKFLPLALASNTDKARSELVPVPSWPPSRPSWATC